MDRPSMARGLRWVSIYRTLACGITLLALAVGAAAQTFPPEKKPHKSARAVALIEWHADAHGVATPRLLPISFLWEGKYYDAGLYEASPRPLALEPGTVYEAVRSGVPQGLFTVRGAAEVKNVWYGDGVWNPGATAPASTGSEDEGPPRLRRPKSGDESTPAPRAGEPPASTPPPPEPDHDRPVLHRGKPTSEPVPPPPPPQQAVAAAKQTTTGARAGGPPTPTKPGPAAASPAVAPEVLVAVSDEQVPESRPYLFQWNNRDEEERLTAGMKSLAEAELTREAGSKPALETVSLHAFDLYSDNEPEIVLSARTTGGAAAPKGLLGQPRVYYVTVVARVTVSGELHKLFASVTADAWLRSVPRMELVDAVDADGDGNGDLLFELLTTSGRSFALYRVGRDQLFQLVEAGPYPNP